MLANTKIAVSVFLIGVFLSSLAGQTAPRNISRNIYYLTYDAVRPVITAVGEEAPKELIAAGTNPKVVWDNWVRKADGEIRTRLEQGDEDSIVNLLLFGTSFTKQPRMTESQMKMLAQERPQNAAQLFQTVLQERLDDFVAALAMPQSNERLRFAKSHLINKLNIRVDTAAGKKIIMDFLVQSVHRVFNESAGFASLVEQAKKNQEDVFIVRSQMFSRRGLSSDTSLKPNLAIENAIAQIKEKGLINKVLRIAIVGPGLDFTDKEEGYDFYPPQTIQPFAVIESLLKLNLTDKNNLTIDTYDLSPKVNSHISGFDTKAKRRENYTINLPLDIERGWTPEFVRYWENFGNTIGLASKQANPSNVLGVRLRSVNIRSEFLGKIHAFDTNIVLQSPSLLENDRYDLIIGTNIFVYYDAFEQALAMRNLEKMLKNGGFLLSNNALIEFPFTDLHSVGYTGTIYSSKKSDGDAIIWYQKK